MLRPVTALTAVLLTLVSCSSSYAETILRATMTNAAERPNPANPTLQNGQPRPASFGDATFVLNDAMTSMTMVANVFNIDFTGQQTADPNDNLLNAHIHAGPNVTTENTGGVVWGFFGAPFNNNNPNDNIVTPFPTGVGGTITGTWNAPEGNNTTLAAQLTNILNQRSYINFHTTQFGGGEVRGMLVVIPEPSTIALLVVGACGLLGFAWSRRKKLA